MRKYFTLFLLFIFTVGAHAQDDELYRQYMEMYKENYIEWISSLEIANLQAKHPDIKKIIDKIPITETRAFSEAVDFMNQNKGKGIDVDFNDIPNILGEQAMKNSMDLIRALLSSENTDLMFAMYWKVIESTESQEIARMILPHIEKAKREVEQAGIGLAQQVRN